jgi:putative MATE family efflux protein
MSDRKERLGSEPVGKLLLRLSAPAIVAMMVNSMYNLVDAIFVGRGVGPIGLAALAVSFPIQMFVLAVGQLVGLGAASVISRALGRGDQRYAERTAGTSFGLVIALSAVLTGLGLLLLEPLLRLFGATDDIVPYASDYMTVILGGAVFFAFAVTSNNLARSEGNTRVAMVSMIIGAVTNACLDPIFIFEREDFFLGQGWGMRGAALATITANACAVAFLILYFRSGRSLLRIRRADLAPRLSVLPEMMRIGLTPFGRVAGGSMVAIVINNSVTHYGDAVHLAVIGVANRTMLFMLMPLFGLVQGLQPIVGYNYGARQIDRVKGVSIRAGAFATLYACAWFVVLESFTPVAVGLFVDERDMIKTAVPILRVLLLGVPVVGFQIVGSTLFLALGKAWPALILSMMRQILVLVPLVLVLPLFFGLDGVWASPPLSDWISAITVAIWLAALWRSLRREQRPHGEAAP